MGLRTASVRHPHVEVMAPALTETVQTQNFDLPPKSCLEPAFPVNSYRKNKFIEQDKQVYSKSSDEYVGKVQLDSNDLKNSLILTSEKLLNNLCNKLHSASDTNNISNSNIMNISPSSMGDQDKKMGLQKTGLDISSLHKESKKSTDMEQLLHNLSVAPEDLETNVEDIMQVIKSIEGCERLNNSSNDLNSEGDEIFPIAGADLTNNLSSFEKEFLENVDVMNIAIEDQQDELETEDKQKESQAKDILNLLQNKHSKIERRLDFLKRRVYKLQSRFLGQHVSSEIAGVFEFVHRSLKKPKEPHEESSMSIFNKNLSQLDKVKPMSYSSAKTLVRKLEMTSVLQASTVARQKNTPKYFGSGSVEIPVPRTNSSSVVTITPWPLDAKSDLQRISAQLKTHTSLTQKEVDSEATESSSGGESCDEMQNYNNPHQQYLSVQKRALWKYSTDRAMIAARWTWLQAQIADLEYRIRQHTDLHKQIRMNKGAIQLGGTSPPHTTSSQTINGYRGQLPGSSPLTSSKVSDNTPIDSPSMEYQCARTRPLTKLRKRKLLQISGLHAVSRKAARPSSVRCGCIPLSNPCALCTGRTDPTHPRDPPDTLSRSEKVALLDPSFHPVFSLPEDTSQSIHLEAMMKTQEWQQRSTRMKTFKVLSKPERHEPKSLEHRTKKLEHRKKYGRLLKTSTLTALSAKIRNKIRGRKPGRPTSLNRIHRKRHLGGDLSTNLTNPLTDSAADEEVESIGNNSNPGVTRSNDSPSSSPLLHMHSISGYNKRSSRFQSYDIDNIVIPYSVAAATRVEKLQYKEILTPKWRVIDPDYGQFETKNNGAVKESGILSDQDDVSEEAVIARHDRCEYEEKKRFLSYLKLPLGYGRARSHRRTDSRAESSGGNTPDPMSPHNPDHHDSPMTSPPATPLSMGATEESQPLPQLPSIAVLRRRTMSQSKFGTGGKEREIKEESRATTPDIVEVPPYEKRAFPINDETYEKMLKHMPEDHQFQTNMRSEDSVDDDNRDLYESYLDQKLDSPDSESTESAIGDGEEDPNDPEWIDMERLNRDRYKR